ncbi:hypothetical protein LTR53_005959 [Teratosphaeriaceae sp. CCFEE 6253]|nr:hypothetical protein LTR53_005959 [Teratosphaeriaceae sp. CCFEE 6253]
MAKEPSAASPKPAKRPRKQLSEGDLMPASFRWRDIRAWYQHHFGVRSSWGQME